MAEVVHRYIGRDAAPDDSERAKLDAKWKQARIDAELARQKVHAAKLLEMKGALIPRQLVQKQAAFLVLSMRARLLQVAEQHARELLGITDEREMQQKLDSIMRSALETLSDMPLKVTDPDWMKRVEEHEAAQAKRPRKSAER